MKNKILSIFLMPMAVICCICAFAVAAHAAVPAPTDMPWAKKIPASLREAYVEPLRVADEPLDSHRAFLQAELIPLLKGKTMAQAAQTVMDWCRSHACLAGSPADLPQSPLGTLALGKGNSQAFATLAVAALRSVGVPARMATVAAWAHKDGGDDWVEAWIDGSWTRYSYQPDGINDAHRAIMVTARDAEGNLLNITPLYAKTNPLTLHVIDEAEQPLADVSVDLCVYSNAAFRPVATFTTDASGNVKFEAGAGDALLWVHKDDMHQAVPVTLGEDSDVTLELSNTPRIGVANIKIRQPEAHGQSAATSGKNTPEQQPSSPLTFAQLKMMVEECGMPDNLYERTREVVEHSVGNYASIVDFLKSVPDEKKTMALRILEGLAPVDLATVSGDVLADVMVQPQPSLYAQYVLPVRVEREPLAPFRQQLVARFDDHARQACRNNPLVWASWVSDNIKANRQWEPSTLRMSPLEVLEQRSTDVVSRDLFFVAGARALGIPARLNPLDGVPQYLNENDRWTDVNLDEISDNTVRPVKKGVLKLTCDEPGRDPLYGIDFTVSKVHHGKLQVLNCDEGSPLSTTFAEGMPLSPGQYMIVSGRRENDSLVLVHTDLVLVLPGRTTKLPLTLP